MAKNSPTDSICRHCGQKIRKDAVTSVWRHTNTRASWCYNSTVAEPVDPKVESDS